MTLRTKLLAAQMPLAVALLLVGLAAVGTLDAVGASGDAILKDNYRSVLAVQRMKDALERQSKEALLRLAGRTSGAPLSDARTAFERELTSQEANITELGEREATTRLRAAWTDWTRSLDAFDANQDPAVRATIYFDALEPRYARLQHDADAILSMNQDAMVHKSEEARRAAGRLRGWLLVTIAVAFVAGLLATTSLTARLLRPLSALRDAANRIGEGKLDARAPVMGGDEFADLSRDFNLMAVRLAQYRSSSLGELLQAQQSSQAAIDALPDPVLVFGERGQVLSLNRAAESQLGAALEIGVDDPLQHAPPAVRDALTKVRAHVLGGRGPWASAGFEDALRVSAPGGDRCYLAFGEPVYGELGGIAGAAVVLRDITRLVFFEEFRNDMVATVAHEFRTPLTSLHLAIHLCVEEAAGPITPRQADLLGAARQDCERLQRIVGDLLDVSRLQSGRLELQRAPCSAGQLLASAQAARHDAERQGLSLTVVDATVSGDVVSADADRIGIVLSNLVQNAIRHSPPGKSVLVRALAADDGLRFDVVDSGPGVPAEFRDRLFSRHFQVPGAPSGGAGLGLFIAREIVLAHGGRIGVEDAEGGGSTFFFVLPRTTPA